MENRQHSGSKKEKSSISLNPFIICCEKKKKNENEIENEARLKN